MKCIVVDDEIAALHTFLPYIVDCPDVECKMFMNDPLAALAYAKNNEVDAAFLDINMPQIDGVELAEKLIEARPAIKLIFISGYLEEEEKLKERFRGHLAGCCCKPYDAEELRRILAALSSDGPELYLRMFDGFDLFVNGRAVKFSSSKSKELLALLADANGGFVTMETAIGALWENKNADLGKRLYRDAVCRLRLTLKDVGAEKLVEFGRGCAVIDPSRAKCDYWDFLKGEGAFTGKYLPQYGWSLQRELQLESLRDS